jgi:hypothetical protein
MDATMTIRATETVGVWLQWLEIVVQGVRGSASSTGRGTVPVMMTGACDLHRLMEIQRCHARGLGLNASGFMSL